MIFSLGIFIILAIIIVIIIVIIAGLVGNIKTDHNNKGKEGGEDVIKNIYIYLVLFATLMMTIGGSVSAFMAVADLVSPTPYYQTYEDYSNWIRDSNQYDRDENENNTKLTESEIRERYDIMLIQERQREVSRAKNSLIKSFGWIVIPFGIFIFFQKKMLKNKD